MFKIKIIVSTEDKINILFDNGIFTFYIKNTDAYGVNSLALKIIKMMSQYEDKKFLLLQSIDQKFMTRLFFQLELYNAVRNNKDKFIISIDCTVDDNKKFDIIKDIFADYYHAVRLPVTSINCETLSLRYREAIAKYNLVNSTKITEIIADDRSELYAIHAVGKAGLTQPKLFIVEFGSDLKEEFDVCLCGKGVCFDTGGVSLKSSCSMVDMNADMGGSALGFYASLCYYLIFKKTVLYATGIAENFIGSNAYRPGDIIESYSGKKIFIGNTDAEGRVVLSDVLAYVSKHYRLQHIITLATLTGAARIVCGVDYCPYVAVKGESVINVINDIKKVTGEYLIALPNEKMFLDGYLEASGEYADINNITKNKYEGSHAPAQFLNYFINRSEHNHDVNYTHFDIANYYEESIDIKRRSSSDLLEFMVEFIYKLSS